MSVRCYIFREGELTLLVAFALILNVVGVVTIHRKTVPNRPPDAAEFINSAPTEAKEPHRCYWCGPLAEQVHRSTRAPICVPSANYITTCEPGFTHCAIVATSPPYVESRYCVKMYQDECYPLYCNTTKTWKMTCPCRGDLCNGQNSIRETEAFLHLSKLVSETHGNRIKRTIVSSVSFIQSKNNKMSVMDHSNDQINKDSFSMNSNCSDTYCKTENSNFTAKMTTTDQINVHTEQLIPDTVPTPIITRENHDTLTTTYTYEETAKYISPINEADSTEVALTEVSRHKVHSDLLVPNATVSLTAPTVSNEKRETAMDNQSESPDVIITSNKVGLTTQMNSDELDSVETILVPLIKDTTTEPNIKKEEHDEPPYNQDRDFISIKETRKTTIDAAETTTSALTEQQQEYTMENQAKPPEIILNSVDTTKTTLMSTSDKEKKNVELSDYIQSDQPLNDAIASASSTIIKDLNNTIDKKPDDSENKNFVTIETLKGIEITTNIDHKIKNAEKTVHTEYIPPTNTVQKTFMKDNLPNKNLPTAEALQQNVNITITTEPTAQTTTQITHVTTLNQNTINVTVRPTKSQNNCAFRISMNIFLIISNLCHFL